MRNVMALLAVTLLATPVALAEHESVEVKKNPHGTVAIVPPEPLMYSFEPMKPDRLPCNMVLTTPVESAPVFYSFARMPDDRAPQVACAAHAAVIQTASVTTVAPPPVVERVAPVVVERTVEPLPPMQELPATASSFPLIGIAGLVSLGGAALARLLRRLLS